MICFFNWGKVKEAAEETSPLRPDDLILEMFPARWTRGRGRTSRDAHPAFGCLVCIQWLFFFLPVILTPPAYLL